MSHLDPFFVSDQHVGLARCNNHVAEWIVSKCSFVPVAGCSYGLK